MDDADRRFVRTANERDDAHIILWTNGWLAKPRAKP